MQDISVRGLNIMELQIIQTSLFLDIFCYFMICYNFFGYIVKAFFNNVVRDLISMPLKSEMLQMLHLLTINYTKEFFYTTTLAIYFDFRIANCVCSSII